jgi:hypothetical protein
MALPAAQPFYMNIYLWIGMSGILFLWFLGSMIFLILLSRRTHAIVEFKASFSGKPIALFFQDNRYCEWRPVPVDAGIIQDKDYGAYIVNEKATYVDRRTKNILIPLDASFGASINIKAAKLADDLQYIIKDEEQMKMFRMAIANNMMDESTLIQGIRTNVQLGALKGMMTALIPHNINAKIEKVIAARLKGYGQINVPQVALLFAAVLGAIILGVIIIKSVFPSKG